jgi:hypothetical protein
MEVSKNVSHICAIVGAVGNLQYHICEIPEVLLFPLPVATYFMCHDLPTSPLIGPLATENGVARRFVPPIHSQTSQKIVPTYLDPHGKAIQPC